MKLFLPQAQLEEWALKDVADVREGRLSVAAEGGSYPVTPAVHFKEVVSGTDDLSLVARVKTEAQLQAMGAEQMADSVLLGETAYVVDPGYVTEVTPPSSSTDETPVRSEADLLAAFLLNKLG